MMDSDDEFVHDEAGGSQDIPGGSQNNPGPTQEAGSGTQGTSRSDEGEGNTPGSSSQSSQPSQGSRSTSRPRAPVPKPPLMPGANYRIIQGQKASSKIVVFERFTYVTDRTEVKNNEAMYYLRCKYFGKACPARAVIKRGVFQVKTEGADHGHNCAPNLAGYDHIVYQEVLSRMKERARTEASSYHVSWYNFF